MQGLSLTLLKDGRKAIIIRTSDRIAFKSCRRKWGFSSHLKGNLGSKSLAAPLWFGSAIHFALEDFHGWNKWGRASKAFRAYCISTAHNYARELPPDAQSLYEMGIAQMDYYEDMWLKGYGRPVDETYWAPNPRTGKLEPQVEVNFEIPIPHEGHPLLEGYVKELNADVVLYRGTIDRVAIDEWGSLWIVEYKTAKILMQQHYSTDPQVTTYVWAASQIYDIPIAGVIYQQFIKQTPTPPRLLANGKLSTASTLATSYPLYRQALVDMFGSPEKAPSVNQAKMNELMTSENMDRDRYIVRDRIFRNPSQCQHEAFKILLEMEDMLNPHLPLYPNPTRDCSRMCSFLTPCINMDDGSDWEQTLEQSYATRDQDVDRMWRRRLPSPEDLMAFGERDTEANLSGIQFMAMEEYKAAQIDAGDYPLSEFEQARLDPFKGMSDKGTFNMAEVSTS